MYRAERYVGICYTVSSILASCCATRQGSVNRHVNRPVDGHVLVVAMLVWKCVILEIVLRMSIIHVPLGSTHHALAVL